MGIKIKTNYNNLLYLFDTIGFEDAKPHYLLMTDNHLNLIEKYNDARFSLQPNKTNKYFEIKKGHNIVSYENKYTIRKPNFLNDALLQKYCGTTVVPSNLIIQFIHNNEDIKKIVSLYLNDAIYALYAISKNKQKNEFVSKISPDYHFVKGTIMCGETEYIDKDAPDINDKNTYDLYQLLNILKQRKSIYGFANNSLATIFEYLKGIASIRNDVAHSKIDQAYDLSKIAAELSNYIMVKGKDFVYQNQLNIYLINQLYADNNVKDELKKYYLYILNEPDKNIGLSLPKIITWSKSLFPPTIKNEEKLKKYHNILRYHLYNYLTKNHELRDKYLILLQEAKAEEKDLLYQKLTQEIGPMPFQEVNDICAPIDFKKNYRKLNNLDDQKIMQEILDIKYDWHHFSLQIYALAKFLTLKETNTLISTLIKKLQSMADLKKAGEIMGLDMANYLKNEDFFIPFNDLDQVIRELRIINSTRRFTSWKNQKIENSFVLEGLKLFKNAYSDEELQAFLAEKSSLTIYQSKRIKNPFKNFIRNNICKAKDFDYIIRYMDAKKVSELLYHKPDLVAFLFSQINPLLIEKYLAYGVTVESISELTLESLAQNIRQGNMDYSLNVKLYLKCLGTLIKNMVRINSSYFIAFSFYERDYKFIDPKYNPEKRIYDAKYNLDLLSFTKQKLKADTTAKAVNNFNLLPKSNNMKNNILVLYRNLIEHLEINNIICATKFPPNFKYRNFFKIYHYCLQKELLTLSTYNDNEFVKECLNDINKYGTYSKKLLYALNAIFLYNSARYKDISAEKIFMKKYEEL